MSSLKRVHGTWRDVLTRLERMSVCWQGKALSDRDRRTYTEAIVLCALHLTDLSSRYDGIGSQRELVAWAINLASLDVAAVGSFMSEVAVRLRSVAEPSTYSSFKRELVRDYPFAGMILAPMRGTLTSFLESPSYRGFYVNYQIFSFITHLTLSDLAVDLEGAYEDTESYLRGVVYDPDLLAEMNSVMREWMDGLRFTPESVHPSHGPGATSDCTRSAGLLPKYQHLGTDGMLSYVYRKFVGCEVDSLFPFPALLLDRTSRAVSVPKSIKTRRWISLSPTTLQYLEQGVARATVDFIHSHSELSRHIDLRRQFLNAQLAIRSSGDSAYGTVDLSSASDTVSFTLVKAVFRGTSLLPLLWALRSHRVILPSGKELVIEKFAPMGSALCFPIQTLIFSCAVEVAVRRRRYTDEDLSSYRVYGDDIIVQQPLFADVLCILKSLGFVINEAKSYAAPFRFRESCGGEGYDGSEVTPMKISRGFMYSPSGGLTSCHASQYEGLVDMANTASSYEFPLLRAWLIRVLLDNQVAPPLFSEEGGGAIASIRPDNYRARSRFNRDRFVMEYEVAVVRPSLETEKEASDAFLCTAIAAAQYPYAQPRLDEARYFETLRLSCERDGDMFSPDHRIQVPRGPSSSKLRKTWVDPINPPKGAGRKLWFDTPSSLWHLLVPDGVDSSDSAQVDAENLRERREQEAYGRLKAGTDAVKRPVLYASLYRIL